MEDIRVVFGNRIRELRKAKKYSQEGLALRAGLDRTYIASMENGNRNVSLINIERIATALGHSLADFFDTEDFSRMPTDAYFMKVAERHSKRYD